jgi:hypothetical protein
MPQVARCPRGGHRAPQSILAGGSQLVSDLVLQRARLPRTLGGERRDRLGSSGRMALVGRPAGGPGDRQAFAGQKVSHLRGTDDKSDHLLLCSTRSDLGAAARRRRRSRSKMPIVGPGPRELRSCRQKRRDRIGVRIVKDCGPGCSGASTIQYHGYRPELAAAARMHENENNGPRNGRRRTPVRHSHDRLGSAALPSGGGGTHA